jgi:hypothetical protein
VPQAAGRDLFAVDSTAGPVRMHTVANGGAIATKWSDTWLPGWDVVLPITSNNVPHLLSYFPSTGQVSIDKILTSGTQDSIRAATWSTDIPWMLAAPLSLSSGSAFMLYTPSVAGSTVGAYVVYDIR